MEGPQVKGPAVKGPQVKGAAGKDEDDEAMFRYLFEDDIVGLEGGGCAMALAQAGRVERNAKAEPTGQGKDILKMLGVGSRGRWMAADRAGHTGDHAEHPLTVTLEEVAVAADVGDLEDVAGADVAAGGGGVEPVDGLAAGHQVQGFGRQAQGPSAKSKVAAKKVLQGKTPATPKDKAVKKATAAPKAKAELKKATEAPRAPSAGAAFRSARPRARSLTR